MTHLGHYRSPALLQSANAKISGWRVGSQTRAEGEAMMSRTAVTFVVLFCSIAAAGAQDARPVWLSKDAIQSRNFSPKPKLAAMCGPAGCCSDPRCAPRYGCENGPNGQSTCTT